MDLVGGPVCCVGNRMLICDLPTKLQHKCRESKEKLFGEKKVHYNGLFFISPAVAVYIPGHDSGKSIGKNIVCNRFCIRKAGVLVCWKKSALKNCLVAEKLSMVNKLSIEKFLNIGVLAKVVGLVYLRASECPGMMP